MEIIATKTVKRGIYYRTPTGRYIGGVEQISHIKTGEQITEYKFTATADSIEINGLKYRVEDSGEYAIKIQRTKIQASNGAKGLIKLFLSDTLDSWERKIIENCKPLPAAQQV